MPVLIIKEGNKHTIVFNEYTAKNKTAYNAKVQEVVVDLMNPLENDGDFKLAKHRMWLFSGSMKILNPDKPDTEDCLARVEYEEGAFVFVPMDKYPVDQIDLNAGESYYIGILNTTVVIDEEYNEVDLQELSEDDRMEIEEDMIDDVNGDESVGEGVSEEEEFDTSFKQYTLKATCDA